MKNFGLFFVNLFWELFEKLGKCGFCGVFLFGFFIILDILLVFIFHNYVHLLSGKIFYLPGNFLILSFNAEAAWANYFLNNSPWITVYLFLGIIISFLLTVLDDFYKWLVVVKLKWFE